MLQPVLPTLLMLGGVGCEVVFTKADRATEGVATVEAVHGVLRPQADEVLSEVVNLSINRAR